MTDEKIDARKLSPEAFDRAVRSFDHRDHWPQEERSRMRSCRGVPRSQSGYEAEGGRSDRGNGENAHRSRAAREARQQPRGGSGFAGNSRATRTTTRGATDSDGRLIA